jgi:hypothetical protein
LFIGGSLSVLDFDAAEVYARLQGLQLSESVEKDYLFGAGKRMSGQWSVMRLTPTICHDVNLRSRL